MFDVGSLPSHLMEVLKNASGVDINCKIYQIKNKEAAYNSAEPYTRYLFLTPACEQLIKVKNLQGPRLETNLQLCHAIRRRATTFSLIYNPHALCVARCSCWQCEFNQAEQTPTALNEHYIITLSSASYLLGAACNAIFHPQRERRARRGEEEKRRQKNTLNKYKTHR